ncbi:long-chain acyl-CoA synthetase [Frankineae bacterium MT45]|nr:long-chain acyl-CoA synthetase [Frankineae bacterium MT45]
MSVAQLMRTPAAAHPGAIAIDGDGRQATFGDLEQASNRVANALIAAGVQRGDRVGFIDRNSTEYWETFLGALKAGAVLVPLNFRLSSDEVSWALNDSGAKIIVAGSAFAATTAPSGLPTVVIDGGSAAGALDYSTWLASAGDGDPGRDAIGDEIIELIYSSGTTGRPKGVLVSAAQQVWSVDAFGGCFDVDAASRSLVPVPYYHVAGGGWALITLSRGGRIIQAREPTAESMLAQIVGYRATNTAMVPAVMQILTQSPEAQSADFSALRQVVYGASPISESLLRASVSLFNAELFQSYGLSETMGVTTLLGPEQHRLDGDLSKLRSAGRAVDGIELDILDVSTGKPLPPGDVGEIVVRGPSVMPGYWQRPEATAEAFTEDGFFRTGDMGSLDEDGFLFIRDRIKDMIVTGGENVYPAEVESALAAHPGVADVAVIGVPSPRWGETPLAVIVPRGAEPAAGEIIEFARARLAHYKCPTQVVFIGELPRNPSGKVLKRELRAPYWEGHGRHVG